MKSSAEYSREGQKPCAKSVPARAVPEAGKSGEGAASALEHLLRQEQARELHNTIEPSADRSAA